MSYGSENVSGIIPAVEVPEAKEARYISNFRPEAKKEYKTNKQETKTMGRATVNTHDPNEFLRRTKRDELTTCEESKSFKYTDRNKAPLPDFKNIEYKPSVSSKDFIKKNAINVIKSSAKKGESKFVDTVGGNSSPLKPSGLVPNYVNKKNYGKVPKYLSKRQESDKQQLSEYQRHVAQAYEENAVKQMSQEERNRIISGLKANWEELHHQYQGLSVVTDTVPKKYRKERMEAEMKQLELDIEMIEKNDEIYVSEF